MNFRKQAFARGAVRSLGMGVVVSALAAGCSTEAPPNGSEEHLGTTEDALNANEHTAYDFFVAKGLKNFQAAGIVGNLIQESNVDPSAVQYGGGPGRGIAQWSVSGRWDNGGTDSATWYANHQGESVWSLNLQLEFIWYELNTFGYGFNQLKNSTDVSGATIAFEDLYEICGNCQQASRINYAQQVLNAWGATPPPPPPPPPFDPPAQVTGNSAVTLINWPADKHAEIFIKTSAGELQHIWTSGTTDNWTQPATLDGGAGCGFAAVMWPPVHNSYGELFSPTADGKTGHLWWANNAWNKLADYGGAGTTKLTTLAWGDGHVEVFGLGPDKAIWHNFWDNAGSKWSDWNSLAGSFATGASTILWGDGHAELFATDDAGIASHMWSGNYPGGWSAWTALKNPAGVSMATEPIPVRWSDGHVEAFARGNDNHLYRTWMDSNGWRPFEVLSASTNIAGVPSVIDNANGPEVFARDDQGKVVHLWWSGTAWNDFIPLDNQISQSDPFGWIRADGAAEVFAVDMGGNLVRIYRNGGNWSAWSAIAGATGIDACLPPTPPAPPTGSTTSTSSGSPATSGAGGGGGASGTGGSGSAADGGPLSKGTCACSAVGSSTGAGGAWAFAIALGFVARRKRRA